MLQNPSFTPIGNRAHRLFWSLAISQPRSSWRTLLPKPTYLDLQKAFPTWITQKSSFVLLAPDANTLRSGPWGTSVPPVCSGSPGTEAYVPSHHICLAVFCHHSLLPALSRHHSYKQVPATSFITCFWPPYFLL